jgi:hypothetical protein
LETCLLDLREKLEGRPTVVRDCPRVARNSL